MTGISATAEKQLGRTGRSLSPGKIMRQPMEIINASIINQKAKKIWYGDLEVKEDREKLMRVSKRLGPLYILKETQEIIMVWLPTPEYVKEKAYVTWKVERSLTARATRHGTACSAGKWAMAAVSEVL